MFEMSMFEIPTPFSIKVFVACQNVYEEKYIDKYDLHPLMVVGYEGTVRSSGSK